MHTTFILSIFVLPSQRTLTRVDLDALPVVAGDQVELWPDGMRATVKRRTLLSGVRACEVALDMPGRISQATLDELVGHGWEVVK